MCLCTSPVQRPQMMRPACLQSMDLSSPAARSADELEEHDARAHTNADNANLGQDRRAADCLKRYNNIRRVGRNSA